MAKNKQTVRQRAAGETEKKPRRLKVSRRRVTGPIKRIGSALSRFKIPLPDNRFGRIVRRIGRFFARILFLSYFREAWSEIRQTSWPTRRETYHLTIAVFVFSVIFTVIVATLDFGLDKVFREIIVKQ